MTRFGWVMATCFAALSIGVSALFHPAPKLLWNASASVPIGLYAVHRSRALHVGELLVVTPPEPLASFLDQRRLPAQRRAAPKARRRSSGSDRLPHRTNDHRRWRRHRRCARPGSSRTSAAGLARLPPHRRRTSLPDEPAIPGFLRRPLFRAAADHHDRRPGRSALDSREGLTMPKRCIPDAVAQPSSRLLPFLLSGPGSAGGP